MERADPKKECPSCGLGVELSANICEFCGWDFEEEDEWILQIEKLERDLLMEKQKFEPGTVNHKIESTLRNPVLEGVEAARSAEAQEPADEDDFASTAQELLSEEASEVPSQVPREEPIAEREEPAPAPKVRTVRAAKAPPEPVNRPVRVAKTPAPEPMPEAAPAQRPTRKVRQVAKPAPAPREEPVTVREGPAPEKKTRTVRAVRRVKS